MPKVAEQRRTEATYAVAEGGKGLYAVVQGELIQNRDPVLRNAFWSTVADSWFKGGKSDPKDCILGLVPSSAEIWLTPTSGLNYVFNVLRAQVTGDQPDMGINGKLTGADLQQQRLSVIAA